MSTLALALATITFELA